MTGATVLTYFFRRLPGRSGFVLNIGPPLDDFPSHDPVGDTRSLVELLSEATRRPKSFLDAEAVRDCVDVNELQAQETGNAVAGAYRDASARIRTRNIARTALAALR